MKDNAAGFLWIFAKDSAVFLTGIGEDIKISYLFP